MTKPDPTRPRGFAAMPPEKRSRIAAMGGHAVPPEKRAFATNPDLAERAGRAGGLAGKKVRS